MIPLLFHQVAAAAGEPRMRGDDPGFLIKSGTEKK